MKIIPTVGRKLWLYNVHGGLNTGSERVDATGVPLHGYDDVGRTQPLDVSIVYVHSTGHSSATIGDGGVVNVAGFDCNGNPFARTSVQIWNGEGSAPPYTHARWMPYQIKTAG